MMAFKDLIRCAAIFCIASTAFAQREMPSDPPIQSGRSGNFKNRGFGVGVMIGAPTALTGKYWVDKNHAWDAALGWSLGSGNDFVVHANWLKHEFGAVKIDQESIDWYYGIGGRLLAIDSSRHKEDDIKLGPRIPTGLRFEFKNIPIETFVEAAVVINLIQSLDLDLNLALGARYYF